MLVQQLGVVWGWLSWVVSRLSWVVFWLLSNTFVSDISNISSIGIGDVVADDLGTTIRKVDTVFTVGGISVTVFVGLEVSFSVVVMDSVSEFVYGWSFFVVWSLAISWSWGMVSWGMYYWFVDDWGVVWSWSWGMVNWSMYWSSMINWGSVVWSGFVDWNMSRSMDSSAVFFSSIWVMYILRGSMGLA